MAGKNFTSVMTSTPPAQSAEMIAFIDGAAAKVKKQRSQRTQGRETKIISVPVNWRVKALKRVCPQLQKLQPSFFIEKALKAIEQTDWSSSPVFYTSAESRAEELHYLCAALSGSAKNLSAGTAMVHDRLHQLYTSTTGMVVERTQITYRWLPRVALYYGMLLLAVEGRGKKDIADIFNRVMNLSLEV